MSTIYHALLIGATAEKVFHALTNQEFLSKWWTPGTEARTELHSIARFPFGDGYFKEMRITGLTPNELVKWNCIKGADEWIGTNISFSLQNQHKDLILKSYPEMSGQVEQQDSDNCTLLVFRHEDWKNESLMFAECSYTWARFLRSLKLLCETGTGCPWPHQHRVSC